MKQSGQPSAVERYRDLAAMSGCREADDSQAMMVLTMGPDWGPVECPHCGTTPTIEDLVKDRPNCEEIGHPEQFQASAFAGHYPVQCVLCGEIPEFTGPVATGDLPDAIALAPLEDRAEICGTNGHRRAAQLVFYAAISDAPTIPEPKPCEVCGRIPDLQPVWDDGPPTIMELEPDGTVHMHILAR